LPLEKANEIYNKDTHMKLVAVYYKEVLDLYVCLLLY